MYTNGVIITARSLKPDLFKCRQRCQEISTVNGLCTGGVSGWRWLHHGGFPQAVAWLAEDYPRHSSPDNHNDQLSLGIPHQGTSRTKMHTGLHMKYSSLFSDLIQNWNMWQILLVLPCQN